MSAPWVAIAIPAVVAWAAIAFLRRTAFARRTLDRPNERSLHTLPTPRLGGIGVMVAAIPIAIAMAGGDGSLEAVLACAGVLAIVSAVDDLRSLPVGVRLAAHLAAATFVAVELGPSGAISVVVVLAIGWMTNLFNFMDGADGLAGGMAMIGFSAYAVAAHAAGQTELAMACAALASAAAGFLVHNFPPARVFLGDAGSIPLGFLAGALGLAGYSRGAWPAWFPLLVFSPFIVDASVTLVRRVTRGERPWRAHRDHYYQRLALSGWSGRRLALSSYALMIGACLAALAGREAGLMLQCGIISVGAAVYALLLVAIEVRLRPAGAAPPPRPR